MTGRSKAYIERRVHRGENPGRFSAQVYAAMAMLVIITAALPIYAGADGNGDTDKLLAVMDIDFIFDELTKLITDIPDEILQSERG